MAEQNLTLKSDAYKQPAVITIVAKVLSYIFHPLFLPTYVFFWLTIRFPFEFAGITPLGMFARKFNVFCI